MLMEIPNSRTSMSQNSREFESFKPRGITCWADDASSHLHGTSEGEYSKRCELASMTSGMVSKTSNAKNIQREKSDQEKISWRIEHSFNDIRTSPMLTWSWMLVKIYQHEDANARPGQLFRSVGQKFADSSDGLN